MPSETVVISLTDNFQISVMLIYKIYLIYFIIIFLTMDIILYSYYKSNQRNDHFVPQTVFDKTINILTYSGKYKGNVMK